MYLLNEAHRYAVKYSDCKKVKVGCIITYHTSGLGEEGVEEIIARGANITIPIRSCFTCGCLREEKYGENNKEHRNPDDCRAVHSEACAVARMVWWKPMLQYPYLTAYVTRYPCEACARLFVLAGIRRVIYGRQQEISNMTKDIFDKENIEVIWVKDWIAEDVTN